MFSFNFFGGKRRKKKKKQRDQYGYDSSFHGDDSYAVGEKNDELVLDYGEAENMRSPAQNVTGLDWDLVDSKWDTLEVIGDIPSLSPGSFVGWKVRSFLIYFIV